MPGLFLVLIGAAILLANYGYLHFYWWNIFRLWPIFLVIAGVNLVFAHNKSVWATILKAAVLIIGMGILFFAPDMGRPYGFFHSFHHHHNKGEDGNDWNNGSDLRSIGNGTFNEPYQAGINTARLNIDGAGITYTLSDTTNQLLSAATTDDKGDRYQFSHSTEGDVHVMDFDMQDHNGINLHTDKNRADFRLNPNPEWEININAAAAKLDFDLSKFKIKSVKLDGAAGSFNIKMGMPLQLTDIEISNIVSGVTIRIPQSAACFIETDSALSGNDFPGFTKTDDDNYKTPGYDTAKNQIHIHIDGLMSGFNVKQY